MSFLQKLSVFFLLFIIINAPFVYTMDKFGITEFKQQFSLMHFPQEIRFNICNLLFNNNDQTSSLSDLIKSALALRSTNTYFNKFLTAKRIGKFCKPFGKKTKDKTLKKILDIDEYKTLRFPSLILIYAKANPNVNTKFHALFERTLYEKDLLFTKILLQHKADPNMQRRGHGYPPLFYAKTKKAAQLLIKYGADINTKDQYENTNILWHLIKFDEYVSQKTNLDLFQFYLDKGVDPKELHPKDNSCLFHHLTKYPDQYSYKLKFIKILIYVIPEMINTVNIKNKTVLDIIINEKEYDENEINIYRINQYKNLKKIITFLQKNGAKTAQQLEEAKYQQEKQIMNENEPDHCLICLMDEELIPIPCDNKHVGSNICQDCCNQLLNNNKTCPLCRAELKNDY